MYVKRVSTSPKQMQQSVLHSLSGGEQDSKPSRQQSTPPVTSGQSPALQAPASQPKIESTCVDPSAHTQQSARAAPRTEQDDQQERGRDEDPRGVPPRSCSRIEIATTPPTRLVARPIRLVKGNGAPVWLLTRGRRLRCQPTTRPSPPPPHVRSKQSRAAGLPLLLLVKPVRTRDEPRHGRRGYSKSDMIEVVAEKVEALADPPAEGLRRVLGEP